MLSVWLSAPEPGIGEVQRVLFLFKDTQRQQIHSTNTNKFNKYKLAFNLFTKTKACRQSRGEAHSHCRGLVLRQSVEPALIELLLQHIDRQVKIWIPKLRIFGTKAKLVYYFALLRRISSRNKILSKLVKIRHFSSFCKNIGQHFAKIQVNFSPKFS